MTPTVVSSFNDVILLACSDRSDVALGSPGARSTCPTDRCITAQDDGTPPAETSLAFRTPLPSGNVPMRNIAQDWFFERALQSRENSVSFFAYHFSTVVLRV
jgi:hypothetical protein